MHLAAHVSEGCKSQTRPVQYEDCCILLAARGDFHTYEEALTARGIPVYADARENLMEAAQKLASDFGLDPKPPTAAAMAKPKRPYIRQFREDEMLCFRVLTDYLHLLEDWKVRYAPKTPEEALDDRFVEACQMHCPIEYMADVLTVGDLEERVALVDELMKEGKITFLQEYITRKKKEVAHHGEEPENA